MQSDIRDIYHGLRVVGFSPLKSSPYKADSMSGIGTEFHLQLSDNSHDEAHLADVFRRYLMQNNYSLGGTKVYSAEQFMDPMKATGKFYSFLKKKI